MTNCNNPQAEEARLQALESYQILDTPAEKDFDDFVSLASNICHAPVAVINLIDRDRQWFKAELGLGVRETPLDVSICRHAILQKGLFIVPDLTRDPRFKDNPFVTGKPHLRFYAGALLETKGGQALGTLCVLDYRTRRLRDDQFHALEILARQIMTALELRRAGREIAAKNRELSAALDKIRTLEGLLPICSQCKKIRDEDTTWMPVETYLRKHTEAEFSHGLCPECSKRYLDELQQLQRV
ncbi:MAG: GAF domain-containing protein [Puniceicoccaceae bacterium]|nr:MAG: GAF domain-containing protein [Puniceicoccaceae bacterium]